MTEPRPGITYRPDAQTRARLETFAERTHRSLQQSITAAVIEMLDRWEAAQKNSVQV